MLLYLSQEVSCHYPEWNPCFKKKSNKMVTTHLGSAADKHSRAGHQVFCSSLARYLMAGGYIWAFDFLEGCCKTRPL